MHINKGNVLAWSTFKNAVNISKDADMFSC